VTGAVVSAGDLKDGVTAGGVGRDGLGDGADEVGVMVVSVRSTVALAWCPPVLAAWVVPFIWTPVFRREAGPGLRYGVMGLPGCQLS
jgi:hypothetical protein